jgi:hypothetical protein
VAGEHRLHGYAIADVDAPSLGRPVADRLDDADRFVPRDDRHFNRQDTVELFVIATANAARFDPQQPRVRVDLWNIEIHRL